jgi:hypothetical protein
MTGSARFKPISDRNISLRRGLADQDDDIKIKKRLQKILGGLISRCNFGRFFKLHSKKRNMRHEIFRDADARRFTQRAGLLSRRDPISS